MSDEYYSLFSFTSKTIIANQSFEIIGRSENDYTKKKIFHYHFIAYNFKPYFIQHKTEFSLKPFVTNQY